MCIKRAISVYCNASQMAHQIIRDFLLKSFYMSEHVLFVLLPITKNECEQVELKLIVLGDNVYLNFPSFYVLEHNSLCFQETHIQKTSHQQILCQFFIPSILRVQKDGPRPPLRAEIVNCISNKYFFIMIKNNLHCVTLQA